MTRAPKPGKRGDGVGKPEIGFVGDSEDELTVGAGRHADRLDAGHAGQVALEAGDARHADEAGHDHAGRRDVG